MTLVYLDIETTGLDFNHHQVWEVAWAVDDADVQSCVVKHTIDGADPRALKINGYLDRVIADLDADPYSGPLETDFRAALKGATVVAANPAFDTSFLRARWGEAPWKYRLLDIEAYAMPALGLDEPKGLAHIAEQLGVVAPDHSAAQDVATLRACHLALRAHYGLFPALTSWLR